MDNDISIGRLIRFIFLQSKLVISIIFLAFALSSAYYLYTDKTYKVNSLIQIYAPEQNFGANMVNNFSLGTSSISDSDSLEDIYLSRSNILDIILVNNLHLNVNKEDREKLDYVDTFIIKSSDESENSIKTYLSLGEDDFSVSTENQDFGTFRYDERYENDSFIFEINKPKEIFNLDIKYSFPGEIVHKIRSRFNIESTLKSNYSFMTRNGSAVLEISYNTTDFKSGISILNFANELFISNNIEAESEKARKALNFIDGRVDKVKEDLEKQKAELNEFRSSNSTLNVDLEIQSIIATLTSIEEEIYATDVEISKANSSFTQINPILQELESKREVLISQKNEINQRIENLPSSQQTYIDLFRTLEITEGLYDELLNRKLAFSITEASTLGNFRIIDKAYKDSIVGPSIIIVPVFMFLAGIFAALLAIYRGIFFLPVTNPAELPDNGIDNSIVGVIPFIGEDDANSISDEAKIQSIESLILNSDLTKDKETDKAKIILLTSPTSGNGKTFLTAQLGERLASIGNKVLMIDNDLKQGDLKKIFNLKEKFSKERFFDIKSDNIDSLKVKPNLFLIPKISFLPSSFQFLFSKEYIEKFEELKTYFDYIVMDTAPILSVSDTSILMNSSDSNILVCRHGKSRINEIKQSIKISNQIGVEFEGVVYNCYQKSSSYYGYYGLYGNYEYQYYANKYLYEQYSYDDKK